MSEQIQREQELVEQLAQAERDGERFCERIEELERRDPRILRCAFCHKEYPPGTPATQNAALTAHILNCAKHPLRARIKTLEAIVENCDKTRDGVVIQPRMILYAKTYRGDVRDVQAVMLVESSIGCYVAAASCWSTWLAAKEQQDMSSAVCGPDEISHEQALADYHHDSLVHPSPAGDKT